MKTKTLIILIVFAVITNAIVAQTYKRQVGKINYEVKDHLGDVSVVLTDVKDYDIVTSKNTAHIQSAINYDAFGMEMPGRIFSSPGYRYGYNGMEKDNELKGNGNSLDYHARIYDPRLGRWLSNDPSQAKYPNLSPYNYCFNNPIRFIDPNGKDPDEARAANIAVSMGLVSREDSKTEREAELQGVTVAATIESGVLLGSVAIAGRFANGLKQGYSTGVASLTKAKGDINDIDYLDIGIAFSFGFVFPNGGLPVDVASETTQAFFDWSPSEGFKNRGNNSLNQKGVKPFLIDLGAGVGSAVVGAVLKKVGLDPSGVTDVAVGTSSELLEAAVGDLLDLAPAPALKSQQELFEEHFKGQQGQVVKPLIGPPTLEQQADSFIEQYGRDAVEKAIMDSHLNEEGCISE